MLHFPIFEPPRYLNPNGYERGINVIGLATISFGLTPAEAAQNLGAQNIELTQRQEPFAFAIMLAKIAYAFAAAERKLDLIDGQSFVVPAIRGQQDDIGKWVGTVTQTSKKHTGLIHRLIIHQDIERGLLIGEVHLFSDSETPSYGVILGRLKNQ